jgi:hypothetical protein
MSAADDILIFGSERAGTTTFGPAASAVIQGAGAGGGAAARLFVVSLLFVLTLNWFAENTAAPPVRQRGEGEQAGDTRGRNGGAPAPGSRAEVSCLETPRASR